jgi:hypothetical protein
VSKKIIVILILILLGSGVYLFMKKSPQSSNPQTSTTQNQPSTSTNQTQGTLKSLLSAGKSQKCTYSSKVGSTSVDGTVYIANGKMREDFTTTSAQTKMNGYMIVDGGYSYVWSDLSNQGIKMAFDQAQPSNAPTSANSQTPNINQAYTYTCSGWAENSSMFTPPTNITFSTITVRPVLPSGTASSGAVTNSSACSACDSLPAGTAKDTCKIQLNCK